MLAIRIKTDGIAMTVDKNVTDIELVEEVNTISKLSFTVYPNTNAYDLIGPTVTDICAYDTFLNDVIFEGRVYSCNDEMDTSGIIFKKLECEGVLGFFCDSIVSNVVFLGTREVEIEENNTTRTEVVQGDNIVGIINWLINNHNNQVPANRQIQIGSICVGMDDSKKILSKSIEIDNDNTYNVLSQLISETMKYEFRVRYYNGHWVFDVAEVFTNATQTNIISGVNMLSISKKSTTENICTRILPLGAVGYVAPDYRENMTPYKNAGNYSEQGRLSLYGYNTPEHPHARIIDGKYVQNDELVARYGVITKTVTYEDIVAHDDKDFLNCVSELYRRAVNEADNLDIGDDAYETNAIDLARAGYNFDSLFVGFCYRIQNPMMNIDTVLRVISKTLKYDDPTASTLKFGKFNVTMSNSSYKKNVSLTRKLNTSAFNAARNMDYRLGGMSVRNVTQSEYNNMSSHLDETIYVATDGGGDIKLYKGDTEIRRGGRVENAAVLTSNASDFIVERQLMMNISPYTKVYYANTPSFVVVQGHYCVNISPDVAVYYDNTNSKWVIGGKDGLYDLIIANKAKFGNRIGKDTGKGFLSDFNGTYPIKYSYIDVDIFSISCDYYGNYGYRYKLNVNYSTVNTPSGNWWESSLTWGTFTKVSRDIYPSNYHNQAFTSKVNDIFIVPVVPSIYNNPSTNLPYGSTDIVGYLVFSGDSNGYGVSYVQITSGGEAVFGAPNISEAELCFNLGISKYAEPI